MHSASSRAVGFYCNHYLGGLTAARRLASDSFKIRLFPQKKMKHKAVRLFSGIISCLCGLVAASAQNLVQVNGEIPSLTERTASVPGLAPAKRPAPPAQMTIKRFSRPGPTAKALARLTENTKLAAARGEKEVPESYIIMMEDGLFPYAYREADGEEHLVDRAGLTLAETATKLVGELGGDLIHVYTFGGGGFSANLTKEQADELRRLPGIKQVTPDRIMDTYAAPSWGQDRINQRASQLDGNTTYKTPGGATVHIYVIDTGVRGTHQEFIGRVGNGFSPLGLNPYEDKASFPNPDPTLPPIISGHGTSVAGTATGAAFGIATTSIVHSVRVSDDSGIMPASTVVAGVDWVRLNRTNPAVVNMSIGGPEAGLDQGILSPITLAVKALISSGITVVAAAGNDSIDADRSTPGRIPEAITVGASDQSDSMASFSNIGLLVDILAPGVAIEAAFHLRAV